MPRESALLGWKSLILLFCLALGLGGMYRFADLGKRPMHTDEAILAVKTQEFWRTGFFEYDPKDYHGPLLHHATRAMGWVRGMGPEDLNERRVRVVAAVCGFALILIPLFFTDALGKLGAGMAALLIGISPMMNFYSRYYIMEMLMVLLGGLLLGLLWCWAKSRRGWWWLLLAGMGVGGMHATKETFIFELGAIFVGVVAVKLTGQSFEAEANSRMMYAPRRQTGSSSWRSWLWFLVGAGFVSVWLFSNGFKDWNGVVESVTTYSSYLTRSEGSGHEKPWDYYLRVLFWYQDGFIWSEAITGVLACLGILAVLFPTKQPRHWYAAQLFLVVHTLALLTAYSLIPYKTPWTILGGQFSLALLAGSGVNWLFKVTGSWLLRMIWMIGLLSGAYHLCRQTNLATDYEFVGEVRYSADSRNPFVYSHTTTNFLRLVKVVRDFTEVDEAGVNLPVSVVQREYGWPLHWYLRDLLRVSYSDRMPEKIDAPVVIVDMDREEVARQRLQAAYANEEMPVYVSSVYGLRPGLNLVLLVRGDLWQRHLEHKQKQKGKARSQETSAISEITPSTVVQRKEEDENKLHPNIMSKLNAELPLMPQLPELEGLVTRPNFVSGAALEGIMQRQESTKWDENMSPVSGDTITPSAAEQNEGIQVLQAEEH